MSRVAEVLLDDATITQAECTAAVEAAKAPFTVWLELVYSCFDLDGNLIEQGG